MSINRFREIPKSVHRIAKFRYFAKVITYSKFPYHVLQGYSYFKSLTFFSEAIAEPLRSISRKLLLKSRNQNIFPIFKINLTHH